ncbi:MAG TPA: kelch repeat-containing protein, partial [Bacteroidia bacterium]|nr:kelch repeat-containing protein [Bacteroidia bacterium]
MKKIKLLLNSSLLSLFSLFLFGQGHAQGIWTAVKNLAPISAGGGAVLLTDGRVMCKGYYSAAGFPGAPDSSWMVLTPDIHGSYINGTWSILTAEHDTRSVFSSQVLSNGNVYVAGGEHGSGGSSAELFNTVTNSWKYLPNVPGWGIYDGNSELLYDGTVIQGCALIYNPDTTILMYNPVTGKLNAGPHCLGSEEETSWLKLPDSSILFVNTITTNSERYIPKLHKWVTDANVPVQLYDPSSEETGPATLLPNGKGFFIGDVGYTAIYTPSGDTNPGTWTTGPNEPIATGSIQLGSWDGPCAAMVNGNVLYSISPLASESLPSFFYEYNYVSNTFLQVGAPGGGDSVETQTNMMTMLDLPDGNILFAYTDSTKFYIYTPSGSPIPQGKPTIDGLFPDSCNRYMITGKLFNGISEGAAFGDDWQMSTNYPVIRLTSGTNVYYAKSFNWNRLGAVQTDSAEDTAYFTLPSLPGGTYSLVVTANGFASSPVSLTTFGVAITSVVNITSCHGTGSATASASYGTKPYTYVWSPSGGTDSIASNLSGGTYTVTVTEVGGCSVSASITITGPGSVLLAPNSKSVTCNGGNNGSASVTASGGLAPYTYTWSNGATTTSITGLTAGTYSVSVSDSCGYFNTANITIVQPVGLSVLAKVIANNKCYGDSSGSARTNVSGGSG